MENKIWEIDDVVCCQQLTADYLEEALTFIDVAFYSHEPICKTFEIAKDPEVLLELRDLSRIAAFDGVTLIAIDKKTKKIVGISLNKLLVRDDSAFEDLAKSWKQPKAHFILEFMATIDNLCDLFDHCQVDSIFEILFLATLPEYKGRGIGRKLVEFSLELATDLANGVNVKKPIDDKSLSLEPRPKIASSIFSSFITQKIGRQLEFERVAEVDFDKLRFQGMDFASVSKTGTTKVTLEYKRL